jgi:hypothetical protein
MVTDFSRVIGIFSAIKALSQLLICLTCFQVTFPPHGFTAGFECFNIYEFPLTARTSPIGFAFNMAAYPRVQVIG